MTGAWSDVPRFTPPEQAGYRFTTIRTDRDLDSNDVDDFLGAFSVQTEDRSFQYPFVIGFDDESASYTFAPVITERPALRPPSGFVAEIHHEAYVKRVKLGNSDAGPVYSYAVGRIDLVQDLSNVMLVGGFLHETPENGDWTLETRAWGFFHQEDVIGAAPCEGSLLIVANDTLERDIRQAWEGRLC